MQTIIMFIVLVVFAVVVLGIFLPVKRVVDDRVDRAYENDDEER